MRSSCRRGVQIAVALVLLIAGGGPVLSGSSAVPARPDDKTVLHVLNRVGFGPRPGEADRVRAMGLEKYIDEQLHPDRISDSAMEARLAGLDTLTMSPRSLADDYFLPAMRARAQAKKDVAQSGGTPPADSAEKERTPEQMQAQRKRREVVDELSEQKILRAAFSDRQLEEVMVDFWFNHFNVFAGKGATRMYLTAYERDAIRPHVFGKFRDLLEATATSPAMLFYLDNWQSADPNAAVGRPAIRPFDASRRRPLPVRPSPRDQGQNNQNTRKRGLNENYGRELMELHTLGVDGGYTQADVIAVARCFTGWTIAGPRQGGGFRFEPRMHDPGDKVVLGHTIKAGGGQDDGEKVLDILAKHPSTARFISTKLVRRFVSDEPPAALVDRATARFQSADGNIREVLRTILTSPEFFAAEAYRAKVKTPFEFVVSAVRATGTDVSNALPLVQTVRQLGMPLYFCQPPTGYADRADAWVNTGALLDRMNFALALVSGRMRGVDAPTTTAPPSPPTTSLVASALAGDVSPATAATLAKAGDAGQAIALTLGSPEFQRR
jgi:uncharacterized protein (DUF1800 family)